MKNIAKISQKDRNAIFKNTAEKMGMTTAIIEKDFWVCYMLDYLFQRNKWKDHIAFKGGTSLSKAYGLINRFSEDIDLILDWRVLDISISEPWNERSNNRQDVFNKMVNKKTEDFLRDEFLPILITDLKQELAKDVICYIDDKDPQTIIFKYNHCFEDKSILQVIRLEIGALAAWTPTIKKKITPYAAEFYGKFFTTKETEILTVLPTRTFWEKVTILHREAYRSDDKPLPMRYSRHYYDVYCMMQTKVKDEALEDTELLDKVVRFKEKFYRCSWAHYELAHMGTIKLIPSKKHLKELEEDYAHMKNMFFGEIPEFNDLLKNIKNLELEINNKSFADN